MEDRPTLAIAMHALLATTDLEYCAYSCNGVNLFGDRKSIEAAMAAFHSHGQIAELKTQIRHWREECGKLHACDRTFITGARS
jgi:hypothetical protein